jgi:hypothetical protein
LLYVGPIGKTPLRHQEWCGGVTINKECSQTLLLGRRTFPVFSIATGATLSPLIVPTLLRDEVTTSNRRRLLKSINKTKEEWEQIRRIVW